MKLLIRNLSRKISEKKLHSLFAVYGIVKSCSLVIDAKTGKSKGFGFVEMDDKIDGIKAIKAMNKTTIDGNQIRVKEVEEVEDNS
jgi:RNA recognition motif-containing protein